MILRMRKSLSTISKEPGNEGNGDEMNDDNESEEDEDEDDDDDAGMREAKIGVRVSEGAGVSE